MNRIYHGGEKIMTTENFGTATAQGVIPHHLHPDGFYMPCKVRLMRVSTGYVQEPAHRPDGSIIYMLPGGKEYAE